MKILVTGGAGYIGSHMVQKLLKQGHDVVVYDNLQVGFREAVPSAAQFVFGDIRDGALVARVCKDFSIEAVVHFAALSVVPDSVRDPISYYENNVVGTLRLLEACVKQQIKYFIFSSSASVYGDKNSSPVSEEADLNPISPYGQSKWMSENLISDFAKAHGLKFAHLRYFNVAGAAVDGSQGQRTQGATHLIKVASEAAVGKRSSITVYGKNYSTIDGTGVRDYIHVEDLADLHSLSLQHLVQGGDSLILNCGYGHGSSVLQVLETMKKISGKNFEIKFADPRPGDAGEVFADVRQLKKTLSWNPQFDNLELICKTAYDWEMKSHLIKH